MPCSCEKTTTDTEATQSSHHETATQNTEIILSSIIIFINRNNQWRLEKMLYKSSQHSTVNTNFVQKILDIYFYTQMFTRWLSFSQKLSNDTR